MVWPEGSREARLANVSRPDQRSQFARDRDRILYSSAFHRLAGVTQIVRAGELDIFHTRQQHTYKVAQIGRRLAENCLERQRKAATLIGIEPEVVEAACLAHDLGHPPFGHAAEKQLDKLVRNAGEHQDEDGYEGNAQTFRILTKLAVRYAADVSHGLDLTRATLAATLKYPWLRDLSDEKKSGKWSAYRADCAAFEWVREPFTGEHRSAEACLMDWADDIAYSVHDLEDFHRAGIIPWATILSDDFRDELVRDVEAGWFSPPTDAPSRIRKALDNVQNIMKAFPAITGGQYDGSREQRRQLRNLTSILIGRYVKNAVSLDEGDPTAPVIIGQESLDEVLLLKHIARRYVIGLPALAAQQFGQRRVISDLFEIFLSQGAKGDLGPLPARLRYIWTDHCGDKPARLAADCVAALTENEALQLHRRLTGYESGSVLDPIVR